MLQPHFYGLHSRMGLRFKPHGSQEVNLGVEEGPDAVVGPDFAAAPFDHVAFSQPEEVPDKDYLTVLAQESRAATEIIVQTLQAGETAVMVGGDHSVAFASLLAIQELFPVEQTAVVMFDSHADLHQTATSPSGNFHGMWLRPFFEPFDVAVIRDQVKAQFQPHQLRYVGNLIVEAAEIAFLEHHRIHQTTGEMLHQPATQAQAVEDFRTWAFSYHHLHVSFDIDMFRADLVPATGTTNPNGLTPEQVWPLLEVVSTHPSVSLDLVEVNPRKKGAEQTIVLAQRALRTLLGQG